MSQDQRDKESRSPATPVARESQNVTVEDQHVVFVLTWHLIAYINAILARPQLCPTTRSEQSATNNYGGYLTHLQTRLPHRRPASCDGKTTTISDKEERS